MRRDLQEASLTARVRRCKTTRRRVKVGVAHVERLANETSNRLRERFTGDDLDHASQDIAREPVMPSCSGLKEQRKARQMTDAFGRTQPQPQDIIALQPERLRVVGCIAEASRISE